MARKVLGLCMLLFLVFAVSAYIGIETNRTYAIDLKVPKIPKPQPPAAPTPSSTPTESGTPTPTPIESKTSSGADPIKVAGMQPPSLADEPLTIEVVQSPDNSSGVDIYPGWVPKITDGRIIGHTKKGDAVIVEISQGGKVLKKLRAGMKGINPDEGYWCEDFNIGVDEANLISESGEMLVTFKYYDDEKEQERVISKRTIKVVKLVEHTGSGRHTWKYGILYDDLLGSAYINQFPAYIFFWACRNDEYFKDLSYKIEVNGQRIDLSNDFTGPSGSAMRLEQEEELWINNDGVVNPYKFFKIQLMPNWYAGPKKSGMERLVALADHPGDWVMKIRDEGKLVRELRFKVDKNGMIVPHPEQDPSKEGFLNLGPNRVFTEIYYPNPNEWDLRFNTDAISKGMMFGRPWVSDEVKNGMLKNLPPANPGKRPFPTPKLPK